jgi:DNA-binding MarR family transcriptional regulator
MIEKDLVKTEDNPDHKKSYLVSMTQQGNKSLVRVNNYQKTLTGVFVDGFDTSIEELVKATNYIRKLRENSLANIESSHTKQ